MEREIKNFQKYSFLVLLIVLFAVQFLYISPKGEFVLNDDWVQADAAKYLAETGEFRLMPFAGPTFYVPILYGTALVKIFGFSFTLLRLSTLVIALLSLISYFLLLNKITSRPLLSFVGILLLWFNPIFYNLSFTFMTDIPALLFLLLSMYFYYTGFEKQKNNFLFWGTVFGLLSAFTRQTGILIIIAAFIYLIIKNSWRILFFLKRGPSGANPQRKKNNIRWNFTGKNLLLSFLLPTALASAIYTYLSIFQLLPLNTASHAIEGVWRLFGHIKWWLWYTPMYLGLFTLPLTLGWLFKHGQTLKTKKFWFIFIIISGLAVLIRQIWHLQFPYIGNVISYYGLGPMKTVLAGQLLPMIPSWTWGMITIACTFGLSLIIYLFSNKRNNTEPTGFIYIFGALYLIPLLIFEGFDRYFLPLLLVLIIALMQNLKHTKFSYAVALILILASGFFSLTQTKFYLSWNQARWDLAEQASMIAGDKTKIDAGYEWDGWNNYWNTLENEKLSFTNEQIQILPWWKRRFFPNKDEQYIISFSKLDGFEIIAEKNLNSSNPNNHLYLIRRNQLAE